MTRITVTEYSPEHDDELVRMWRAAVEQGVGVKDPHPLSAQRQYLHERVLPGHGVRLAWSDGVLVGFLAANEQSVCQLHVRPGYHRQRIGSHLLSLAKRNSSGSLWLYTFQQNLVARRFYEHHGFRALEFGFEAEWQLPDVKYVWVAAGDAA